ncbi:antitoxin [Mycobacterium sp. M1]|uniref:Antitoxin n=1 Tax=Mycolicibacter acidiphilus TaxID=2835306 RepID=A0ABS5RJA4_9MYCO|nr:antitoxin [Mycolicibacter acidiphilus]MBS9533663.1 antitoxin [Mycolicibacter acidiphilus]
MGDLLIRDVPDDVIARLDVQAARLGLSRAEYVHRQLAATPAASQRSVTPADMERFAQNCAGLADEDLMRKAWGW